MESENNNLRFCAEEDKSVIYDTVSDRDICSYYDEQMRDFLLNLLNTYSKKVSFDKKDSGEQKTDLIKKYRVRLETLKDYRATLVDFNTDAENDRIDGEIRMVAEFISDLKECGMV